MISLLKGKVVKKSPELTVVETAGVGYGVVVSARTFGDLPGNGKDEVILTIHTHLSVNSREGALELFGFSEPYEAEMFKKLLGISGIGPRAALKILAAIPAEEIAEAVVKGDLDKKKIPGLGAKRAATIMNELKDKVSSPAAAPAASADREAVEGIVSALKNYGFRTAEIDAAMKEIEKIAKSGKRIEDAVKLALGVIKK